MYNTCTYCTVDNCTLKTNYSSFPDYQSTAAKPQPTDQADHRTCDQDERNNSREVDHQGKTLTNAMNVMIICCCCSLICLVFLLQSLMRWMT